MEVVCKSEYQDIYRIKPGVLLVINKFKVNLNERIPIGYSGRRYAEGCQESLKILVCDKYDRYYGKTYKAGQVLYYGSPAELADKKDWEYQIKTTDKSFSGNRNEILSMINDIKNIIEESGE